MRISFKFLLSIALLLCGLLQPVRAAFQGGVPLWTNRYNGPGNALDWSRALAVDINGNVFVTGESFGANGFYGYATIKYSSAGIPLWTNRYNGPANDDGARALVVDASGNVFVTGGSPKGSGTDNDYATIKYSNAGIPLWTNRYNGPANNSDFANAIAVDGSGNVIVTGSSWGNGTYYDYATLKYSSAGVPLWTNRYSGPGFGTDYALALAVDGAGNVIVTGDSYDGLNLYRATIKYSAAGVALWTNRYNGGGQNVAVDRNGNVFVTGSATIKYSSAGVPLWTNLTSAHAMAVDDSGNVFVTGESIARTGDYITVAYSGAGVPLWTNRYNGPSNAVDVPWGIAVDRGGNVFVTGYADNIDPPGTNGDWTTIAYSNAGVPLWTNRYNGPGNSFDQGSAVSVDGDGNVIVTGFSTGSGTGYDYTTIKYSTSIVPQPRLDYRRMNNQLVLSWINAGFTLQAAPVVPGAFTNIPGAMSPHTNALIGAQQFFRLISN